jgi:hypothetical protein
MKNAFLIVLSQLVYLCLTHYEALLAECVHVMPTIFSKRQINKRLLENVSIKGFSNLCINVFSKPG